MIFPQLILKIERWKFNKDYGVYVSTLGHFKDRRKRNLSVKVNQRGYCMVVTETGAILAHRLVMFTWKPIPNAENLTVDHKNHNKRDNALENLEWVSYEENQRRAKEDFIKLTDSEPKRPAVSPNMTHKDFAVSHYFVNKKTGEYFEDAIAAVRWWHLMANMGELTDEEAMNSAIKLTTKVRKNQPYGKYHWEAIPHEKGE